MRRRAALLGHAVTPQHRRAAAVLAAVESQA